MSVMFYTDANLRRVGESLRNDYLVIQRWYQWIINYITTQWYGSKIVTNNGEDEENLINKNN